MAELHESLIVRMRKRLFNQGYRLEKSVTPTYRADIYAMKRNDRRAGVKQIVVEAEIQSTLFSEHTSEQLTLMEDFINHQGAQGIAIDGVLLIPSDKTTFRQATSLLRALFPEGTKIRIMQL